MVTSPVNTTRFHFWPQYNAGQVQLPSDDDLDDEDRWLDGALLHPDENDNEWFGACVLGRGVSGQVGMWVKLDPSGSVIDRMAVKDIKFQGARWISPVHWRDRLPTDIAVQKRLEDQGGHINIAKYRGYRLNMMQRKYRLYNNVSDFKSVASALSYYSKMWSVRRLWAAYRMDEEGDDPVDADQWEDLFNKVLGMPRTFEFIRKTEEFPVTLEEIAVIPEAFLWRVFQQLVEACTFLRDGAGRQMQIDREWRPILHRDLHLHKVFLQPQEKEDAVPLPEDELNLFSNIYVEDPIDFRAANRVDMFEEGSVSKLPQARISHTNTISGRPSCLLIMIVQFSTCKIQQTSMRTTPSTMSSTRQYKYLKTLNSPDILQ